MVMMMIMLMTERKMLPAVIIILINWRMLLGQQINEEETAMGTWNWMTDGNAQKKPKMCGNVEVAALMGLDHWRWLKEDFHTKRSCPEFPRKARCWQTDCSGIPAGLIRYWTFLSVSGDLSVPLTFRVCPSPWPWALRIFCRRRKTDRDRHRVAIRRWAACSSPRF